jgi:hypothetical protein
MTREEDESRARDATDEKEDDAVRALLKQSLVTKKAEPPVPAEFLRGVQRRIRTRSRGKFYADGWSTSSSRVSYVLIAGAMLIVIAVAYFALGPMGVTAR